MPRTGKSSYIKWLKTNAQAKDVGIKSDIWNFNPGVLNMEEPIINGIGAILFEVFQSDTKIQQKLKLGA